MAGWGANEQSQGALPPRERREITARSRSLYAWFTSSLVVVAALATVTDLGAPLDLAVTKKAVARSPTPATLPIAMPAAAPPESPLPPDDDGEAGGGVFGGLGGRLGLGGGG